jgi:uncharacterized membrane protein
MIVTCLREHDSMNVLFSADPAIQLHAIAAVGALLLGAVQFSTRAGAVIHRRLGYVWVGLMLFVTISSFFISANPVIGQFSWIHGLSIFTTVALIIGVIAARRGQRKAHRAIMLNVFWFALVVTGIFTLLPGRLMHEIVFG